MKPTILTETDSHIGRWRRLAGCILLLVFLPAYVLLAVWIADHLPDNRLIDLIYYTVAGLGWGLPVIPLLSWMGGPVRTSA